MNLDTRIIKKIKHYQPKDGLDTSSKLFLYLVSCKHDQVKEHSERVALLSEAVAIALKKDSKAAFFAGLLHDLGKLLLPSELFDGHNINAEEYEEVKGHAILGFKALEKIHLFTAVTSGVHHALYKSGYGLAIKDFPKDWNPATIKKVLEISAIVSVCDFIDAYTHRETEIKDGSDKKTNNLKGMLKDKYPNDLQIIDIALEENKKINC